MFRHLGIFLIFLFMVSCSSDSVKSPSEAPQKAANEAAKKPTPAPTEVRTNSATAIFLGKNMQDLKVTGGAKLSKYYMLFLVKGRIRVNLAVPDLKKGTYTADQAGQGVALTLTGAGEPGKVSIRPMRSATIIIEKDGDIIAGSYQGLVAGRGEQPIELQGRFLFERKLIK